MHESCILKSEIKARVLPGYRPDIIKQNNLLNAVEDIEFCKLGSEKPADTIPHVVFNIHFTLSFFDLSFHLALKNNIYSTLIVVNLYLILDQYEALYSLPIFQATLCLLRTWFQMEK